MTTVHRRSGSPSWLAQVSLLTGPVLSTLDSSVTNVLTVTIADDFGITVDAVRWVVSGYLLAFAVGLANTSWLGRRYGAGRVYLAALAGFLIASVGCAVAPGIGFLITARIVQGAFGAPLMPLALTVILGPGRTRPSAMAGLLLFLVPALGPVVGGLALPLIGWRGIFWATIPVAALGLLLGRWISPTSTVSRPDRADFLGVLVLSVALAALLFGAHTGPVAGWTTPGVVGVLVGGVLLMGVFLARSRTVREPAISWNVLADRTNLLFAALIAVAYVVVGSTLFTIPVFLQQVQGLSPASTGLVLLPQGLVTGLSIVAGQRLVTVLGIRRLVATGFLLLGASSLLFVVVGTSTPTWVVSALLVGRAAAVGLVVSPLITLGAARFEESLRVDANTFLVMVERLGAAFGIGLLASLYVVRSESQDSISALHLLAVVLTGLAAIGLAASLWLRRGPDRSDGGVE